MSCASRATPRLTVREGAGRADLRRFYDLFLRSMRRMGVLAPSFTQLAETQALLAPSGEFRLHLAEHRGRLVGAAVNLQLGDTVDAQYLATDCASRGALRTDHALYWSCLAGAIVEGRRRMDLGEAPLTGGSAVFKRRWSAEPVPFQDWLYAPSSRLGAVPSALEAVYGDRRQGVGRAFGKVWQRVPLRVVQLTSWAAQRYA